MRVQDGESGSIWLEVLVNCVLFARDGVRIAAVAPLVVSVYYLCHHEERALVSVIGPTAGSGVRVEHWRYTAAFSRGPSRPWHTVFLNPPGIRYEGRIGDRHVRCDGAQHSIGIVPAGADCGLQVYASSWEVLASCVEPERFSAFALNAGVPIADMKTSSTEMRRFLPCPGDRVHRQGQRQRASRVRRQGLDRHH